MLRGQLSSFSSHFDGDYYSFNLLNIPLQTTISVICTCISSNICTSQVCISDNGQYMAVCDGERTNVYDIQVRN